MGLQDIFIDNLKRYRKKKGMTQNELTIALNKGYNYINGVEQKKSFPSLDVIEQIAQVLEIEPYMLFLQDRMQDIKESSTDEYIQKLSQTICKNLEETIKEQIRQVLCSI